MAQQIQTNLGDLEASIQASRDSVEKGGQVLDEMLASVSAVHSSMAEDSEIWKELGALLELWEERRKETLQKSESNPAFLPIAQAWQTKLDTARELRNQISTERANFVVLMRSIESDRDIVLAYYELGQADKAIEGLQKVGASLASLNENMQTIVRTADAAQQPLIPQRPLGKPCISLLSVRGHAALLALTLSLALPGVAPLAADPDAAVLEDPERAVLEARIREVRELLTTLDGLQNHLAGLAETTLNHAEPR